jgi:hypothetical protein
MGLNIIDQFSYLHLASGIIAYYWGITLKMWTILHIIFELIENTPQGIHIINNYITFWPGGKPNADSINNSVSDIIFGILGWMSAYYINYLHTKYSKHL